MTICMTIFFTFCEWLNALKDVTGSKRKRFKKSFEHVLSKKLQDEGVKCWLEQKSNWFGKEDGRKASQYWSGRYQCISPDCRLTFYARVETEPFWNEIVKVLIICDGRQQHTNFLEPLRATRLTGDERDNVKCQVASKDLHELIEENNDYNEQNKNKTNCNCLLSFLYYSKCFSSIKVKPKITNKSLLAVLKSEFKLRNRISRDIVLDSQASKILCDYMCVPTTHLRGFIQEIQQFPFGLLLLSAIQVIYVFCFNTSLAKILLTSYKIQMWSFIQKANPIWYFDATGSVLKNIVGQKRTLLYSFVCYDTVRNKLVPIVEFFTNNHTQTSISKFLFSIKKYFQQVTCVGQKFDIAPVIVVDQSWALINAVIEIFNNCSLVQYLDESFDVIIDQKMKSYLTTKICICSIHFLKSISRKARAIKVEKKVREAFIFGFTLLQHSAIIKEFQSNLIDLFIVFNSKQLTKSALNAIKNIKKKILERKLTNERLINEADDESDGKQPLIEDNFMFYQAEYVQNLRERSKFFDYFNKLIDLYNIELQKHTMETGAISNPYYSTELFNLIRAELPLLTLWSGIFINHKTKSNVNLVNIKVPNNNPVERWFGYLKNNILKKRTNSMPSEFVGPLYCRLKYFFYEYFSENESESNFKSTSSDKVESWKPKFKIMRERGYYLKNKELFTDLNQNESYDQNGDFLTAFLIDNFTSNSHILGSYDTIDSTEAVNQTCALILSELGEKSVKFIKETLSKHTDTANLATCIIKSCSKSVTYTSNNDNEDDTFQSIISATQGLHQFFPSFTSKDGNCFYHALSRLLFGSEAFSPMIRFALAITLIQNEQLFSFILSYYGSNIIFDTLLMSVCTDGRWANEFIIGASSILTSRPIYVYSLTTHGNQMNFIYNLDLDNENNCPLTIAFRVNHFVALLPRSSESKAPVPSDRYFNHL